MPRDPSVIVLLPYGDTPRGPGIARSRTENIRSFFCTRREVGVEATGISRRKPFLTDIGIPTAVNSTSTKVASGASAAEDSEKCKLALISRVEHDFTSSARIGVQLFPRIGDTKSITHCAVRGGFARFRQALSCHQCDRRV